MATLFDIVTYHSRKYVELGGDTAAKDLIRKKVTKLRAIEPDMLAYPEGLIEIEPSGAISITGYSDELKQLILNHLK